MPHQWKKTLALPEFSNVESASLWLANNFDLLLNAYICYKVVDSLSRLNSCNHTFHKECITRYIDEHLFNETTPCCLLCEQSCSHNNITEDKPVLVEKMIQLAKKQLSKDT